MDVSAIISKIKVLQDSINSIAAQNNNIRASQDQLQSQIQSNTNELDNLNEELLHLTDALHAYSEELEKPVIQPEVAETIEEAATVGKVEETAADEIVEEEASTEQLGQAINIEESKISAENTSEEEQEGASINESFSNSEDALGDKLRASAVEQLKKSITLNDRFAFIDQLFGGEQTVYDSSINKLDAMSDFNSATSFIEEIKGQYDWSGNPSLAEHFVKVVKRKFTAN